MKNLYTLLAILFLSAPAFSQCMVESWSLEKRVTNSSVVVEARVIQKQSVWDIHHRNIYTLNTLEIYKVFKGSTGQSQITLVTCGGRVGDRMHDVHPSLELENNEVGVFLLTQNSFPVANGEALYKATASTQSFIKYDPVLMEANDWERSYQSIKFELYQALRAITELSIEEVKPYDPEKNKGKIIALSPPVVSSIDLDTVSSGTTSVLTISGSNFGSTRGSNGKVGFKDANFGDGRYYYPPISYYYQSWSDTKIEMIVPTRAGTGKIQVNNDNNESTESSFSVNIKYAHLNSDIPLGSDTIGYEKDHIKKDNNGGYSWRMTSDFESNTAAVQSFILALEEWRCKTQMNWDVGQTSSVDELSDDNINIVRFDSLGGNVLGRCWTRTSYCTSGSDIVLYVDELDIEYDLDVDWYYGTANTPSGKVDFQTVSTHELGHGHQLGHVIDNTKIMHYSLGPGQKRVDLSHYDKQGGNYVKSKSVQFNTCGPNAMTAIAIGDCSLTIPKASFSASETSICPGDTVTFTDESLGSIKVYSWNFGAGSWPPIGVTKGPHKIVFNTVGTREVFLYASNDYGKDTASIIITINADTPSMPGSFLLADSICLGLQTFSFVDVPNADGYSWSLSGGGSFIGSNSGSSVDIDWTAAGPKTVTVVASNLCGISDPRIETFEVLPDAVADFNYSDDGLKVDFTNTSTDALTYAWSFGDGSTSTDTNASYEYGDKGTYNVKLKASNQCNSDSVQQNISVNFPASIHDIEGSIKLYPHPVKSNEIIHVKGVECKTYDVHALTGQLLFSGAVMEQSFTTPKLSDGIYVLTLYNDGKAMQYKLHVQKE